MNKMFKILTHGLHTNSCFLRGKFMIQFVALLLTLFLTPSFTSAAEKSIKNRMSNVTAKSELKHWKPSPFDPGTEHLPPNYLGVDPIKFYKLFKAKISALTKGEFETTEEFDRRIANKDEVLYPISTVDLYAFRMPKDISIKYNADEQAYLIGGEHGYYCEKTYSFGISKGWVTCMVASISEKNTTYIGSNAFGAVRSIKRTRGLNFALAIHEDTQVLNLAFLQNKYLSNQYSYNIKFNVPVEKARELKDSKIGILFVGRVCDAKLIEGVPILQKPEIGFPKDIIIDEEAVPFEVKKIILYVVKTGEIIEQKDF